MYILQNGYKIRKRDLVLLKGKLCVRGIKP